MFKQKEKHSGFTLIELLVVIAIIGILASVVIMSLSESRAKGRDAGRKSQIQEILKALELHYSDGGTYPDDGTPLDNTTGGTFTTIGSGLVGGRYFKRLPDESDIYQYCVSANRQSMMIAVNTEQDKGGSNYCSITRGSGSDFGCNTWLTTNAASPCSTRF